MAEPGHLDLKTGHFACAKCGHDFPMLPEVGEGAHPGHGGPAPQLAPNHFVHSECGGNEGKSSTSEVDEAEVEAYYRQHGAEYPGTEPTATVELAHESRPRQNPVERVAGTAGPSRSKAKSRTAATAD